MARFEVHVAETLADLQDALAVRRRVFIEEQSVPEAIEIDEHDRDPGNSDSVVHVVGRLDGAAVATGRLLAAHDENEYAHVGRVAVLAAHRRRGFGRAVMLSLHDIARQRGWPGITLAAQLHAVPFYEALGYSARGGPFLDAGIMHRWMDLSL